MKAIMISIKPKWVAKILNGKKTIEIRKSKGLYKAISKLIEQYGYADFYVYCTKDKQDSLVNADLIRPPFPHPRTYMLGHKDYSLNGKVIFKFRCYKVEEIEDCLGALLTESLGCLELLQKSCLWYEELYTYLSPRGNDDIRGYAIHISDLKIFDKPKELSEFKTIHKYKTCDNCPHFADDNYLFCDKCKESKPLTKAPQSFVYLEVE